MGRTCVITGAASGTAIRERVGAVAETLSAGQARTFVIGPSALARDVIPEGNLDR